MRIQIQLSEASVITLIEISKHEHRELRQQAAWIIEQEIERYRQRIEPKNSLEIDDHTTGKITTEELLTIQR